VLLARIEVCFKVRQGVQRLLEAERQRVMLQSIDAACNRLAQPLMPMTCALELLVRDDTQSPSARAQLQRVLEWTREAGQVLQRLREVAQMRSGSYLDHLQMIDPRPQD
jgi:hypothetical protein